ncbi:MAG: DNA-directed RNA polymerase subunit omega, partial [Calditrichaeota bacterium]|nr:DNA-directed RNA polymerase subunit omega [Calditrichota bacterium]
VPTPRKLEPEERRLNWLVHDFQGLSDNIYEAVMVAAHRARQIGRRQKREIEDFKSSLANVEESLDDENNANRGIDHFQHSKPTVLALKELRERKYRYYYPEHLRK